MTVRIDLDNSIINADMEYIYSKDVPWGNLTDRSVLVTGAYGMLASYVVAFLCFMNENHDSNITIYATGRNEDKMRARFGTAMDKAYFHALYCDVSDSNLQIPQVDFIIHAASGASPNLYSKCPVNVAEANAIGTYNLLKAATDMDLKGFLFFSSGDIYGKIEGKKAITESDCGATDPLTLHSCYSESKRMAETWCSVFNYQYKVPTKIVRIGHTYGPTMDVENDPRVFASFMKCIIEGRDIEMLSSGRAKRPFCYLADAVVAFFIVLLKGTSGEAYNVCNTDEFTSIADLAEILCNLRQDKQLKVIRKSRDNDGYVENADNEANCPLETKLKELGWEHDIGISEGFRRVYEYLKGITQQLKI